MDIKIGQLYNSRTQWPEGSEYNYIGGCHSLGLFVARPTPKEILGVQRAPMEFALTVEGDVIFLLWKIQGAFPWCDAPYSWHKVPLEHRTLPATLPPGMEKRRYEILQIVLIDATTGILKAMRAVVLPPQLMAALNAAITAQSQRPFDRADYDLQEAELYRKYPTPKALLDRAQIHCRVGV